MKTILAAFACALVLAPAARAQEAPKPAPKKPDAAAARPAKEGGFGSKRGGPLLTREELRACLARQDAIRTQSDDLGRQRAALDAEKAELVKSGDALKAELEALDRGNQEAVDQYNARAAERDKRIDAYEAATTAFNARAEALKTEREGFARACDNRRYDEADELAIKRGR